MKKKIKDRKTISKKRPLFVVVEGGEGSGKTTLIRALKEDLGDKILVTREPGGSPYAEIIREATIKNPLAKTAPAETTLCLMFAARYDNLANMVVPALEQGKPVIADRFDSASYAYQVVTQSRGKAERLFWSLRKEMVTFPDLYVLVDVEPEEGVRRARTRNGASGEAKKYDHFDNREIEFHESVRKGLFEFLSKVPHIVIDANRPLEAVKKDFLKIMRKLLM